MAPSRYGRLAALAALLLLIAGCDLMSLPFFLSGADSRIKPELVSLTPKEKDKQVRVLVMAYCGLVADPQLVTADREVTRHVIHSLQKALHDDRDKGKDKVIFVVNSHIDRYKDAHPDWHINLIDAGKHFHADYVIYLELQSMSLFESKSYNQFLHGQADVHVKLIDMRQPDDPAEEKGFRCDYPRTGPVQAEDCRLEQFRNDFYEEIATKVCWLFAPHETPSSF